MVLYIDVPFTVMWLPQSQRHSYMLILFSIYTSIIVKRPNRSPIQLRLCVHPHERLFPARRYLPNTGFMVPHSHLHNHFAPRDLPSFFTGSKTSHLPKRRPVKSSIILSPLSNVFLSIYNSYPRCCPSLGFHRFELVYRGLCC